MKEQCSVCKKPVHTDTFKKIYDVIYGELKRRDIRESEDDGELAKALSILVADALEIDIYTE